MRVLAPPPKSAFETEIMEGYQICARCGEVMAAGDKALVVRRSEYWYIFSHVDYCDEKGVKGWKAAGYADNVRESPSKKSKAQEGSPILLLGKLRPTVFTLDKQHLDAELALVDYRPSGEMPLSNVHTGENHDLADDALGSIRKSRWAKFDRNRVEDEFIDEIDGTGLSENAELLREAVWECRKRSYAQVRPAPETEEREQSSFVEHGAREIPSEDLLPVLELAAQVRLVRRRYYEKKIRSTGTGSEVLTWDVKGRPGEWALYSRKTIQRCNGKKLAELGCWQPAPQPLRLPYSSTNDRQHYIFEAQERDAKPRLHGPVAYLCRERIAELNATPELGFRGENIQHREANDLLEFNPHHAGSQEVPHRANPRRRERPHKELPAYGRKIRSKNHSRR